MTFQDFIVKENIHLTHSQKILSQRLWDDISLKNNLTSEQIIQKFVPSLLTLPNPVARGESFFKRLRKMRYPLSDGKEDFSIYVERENSSQSVENLNTKERLINRYCYGDGVFDMGEYVLSLIRSCPLDCAYCFIRELYDHPHFKIEPDYLKIKKELTVLLAHEKYIYLNAGENADSLMLDAEYGLIEKIWKIIEEYPQVMVEFRTKTNKIQKLLDLGSCERRLIMAFSLNPEEDRTLFETNTATILQRIEALQKLTKGEISVALRFEPIIYSENFIEKYGKLFSVIFKRTNIQYVHSVSLGCLRLTKGLHKKLSFSHPKVLFEEWVLGPDKKYRYFKDIRIHIYRVLLSMIANYFPKDRIVLSTEPAPIWENCNLPLKTMPEIAKGGRILC